MKYYVTSVRKGYDEYVSLVTEDKEEAINEAIGEWELLCDADRKVFTIEVRAYVEDIEDESCTCFDYDTVEWKENGNGRH